MSDMHEAERTHVQDASAQDIPTQHRGSEATASAVLPTPTARVTGWVGWVMFASAIMIMVGAFQIIAGFTALLYRGFYLVSDTGLLVHVNYTAWGAVHLALGLVAVIAGMALLAGRMWARVVGITMAVISAIVNLAFIPAYPVWSVIIIALDVVVIYAIAAHGREAAARRGHTRDLV